MAGTANYRYQAKNFVVEAQQFNLGDSAMLAGFIAPLSGAVTSASGVLTSTLSGGSWQFGDVSGITVKIPALSGAGPADIRLIFSATDWVVKEGGVITRYVSTDFYRRFDPII